MNFRVWLERQFLELPQSAKADIERFSNKLTKVIPTLTKQGNEYLGSVNVGGHRVEIYAHTTSCHYDPVNDKVAIDYETLNNPEAVKSVLVHELTHAIDPKSQFPQSAEDRRKYQQWFQDKDPRYFQDPREFDAYGANFADNLRRTLSNMYLPVRQQIITQIKNWLRSPVKLTFNNADTHSLVNYLQSAQRAWRQNPKLWKMFQQRVYSILDKL